MSITNSRFPGINSGFVDSGLAVRSDEQVIDWGKSALNSKFNIKKNESHTIFLCICSIMSTNTCSNFLPENPLL